MTPPPAPAPAQISIDRDLLPQCLQRQLEELEAIELIYPPDIEAYNGAETVRVALGPREAVQRALVDTELLQLWTTDNDEETPLAPLLSLTVGRSPCPCLQIQLPPLYPERGHPPRLRWAEGANRSRAELEAGLLRLSEVSEAHEESGGEHLLEIVHAFQQMEVERREAAVQREQEEEEKRAAGATAAVEGPKALVRLLIYFHHMINATKRDVVKREAVAHGLGGYSKIGWPGVVVVEGEEGAVRDYVRLLQTLRWQQMTVRGEERVELEDGQGVDDARQLHRGFLELGQNGLGQLMEALREAGLAELGATLMR